MRPFAALILLAVGLLGLCSAQPDSDSSYVVTCCTMGIARYAQPLSDYVPNLCATVTIRMSRSGDQYAHSSSNAAGIKVLSLYYDSSRQIVECAAIDAMYDYSLQSFSTEQGGLSRDLKDMTFESVFDSGSHYASRNSTFQEAEGGDLFMITVKYPVVLP